MSKVSEPLLTHSMDSKGKGVCSAMMGAHFKTVGSAPPTPVRLYSSCAIVSSSDSLLNSQFGQAIDNHDVVVRFNLPPMHPKYAKDVGSKLNIIFATASNFAPVSPSWVPKKPAMITQLFRSKVQDYLRYAPHPQPAIVLQSMCAKCRDLDMRCALNCTTAFCSGLRGCADAGVSCTVLDVNVVRVATMRYQEEFRPAKMGKHAASKPGSGWIGAVWANMTCSSIDFYGFPIRSTGRHYYSERDRETGMIKEYDARKHNVSRENLRLRQLFKGRARFWDWP